jgi:hypothetical protein
MTEKEKFYQFGVKWAQQYQYYGKKKIDWDHAKMFLNSGRIQLEYHLSLKGMSLTRKRLDAFEDGFFNTLGLNWQA